MWEKKRSLNISLSGMFAKRKRDLHPSKAVWHGTHGGGGKEKKDGKREGRAVRIVYFWDPSSKHLVLCPL